MDIMIRKFGNLCDISPDGVVALPDSISEILLPFLTYQHKSFLRGAAAYDLEGQRHQIRIEHRPLYKFEQGRLTTGAGFIPRLGGILRQAGHTVHVVDLVLSTALNIARPDRYEIDRENMHRHVTFRPKQEECVEAILANPGGIIEGATGFGKSHMFITLAALFPKAKIHVVVNGLDIISGLMMRLVKHFPNVGQFGGGHKRFGDRITVFSASSLEYSDSDCDILLCDEVHELMADSYAKLLAELYPDSRNYGFSATPYDRMDGASARLECLFGPRIFHLSYQEAVSLGLATPIEVRWIPVNLDTNPAQNRTDVQRQRWGIWRNEGRNNLIASAARSFTVDDQVLILVQTLEHAVALYQHLPEYELCYGSMSSEKLAYFKKHRMLLDNFIPMTTARKLQMQQDFESGKLKRVIATDVWATGVDFQQLGVLIRADDRSSVIKSSQGPGRVSRIAENKPMSQVIDFIDYFDEALLNKSKARRRVYLNLGWGEDWPTQTRRV